MRVVRVGVGEESGILGAAAIFDEAPIPAAARAYVADERNIFLLAYEGTIPVGFLRGTELLQLTTHRRQMFLNEIGVVPEFRQRGVGRALIDNLLEYCRTRDFEEVFVMTDPTNEAAVRLYRSAGATTETPADRMFVYPLGEGL